MRDWGFAGVDRHIEQPDDDLEPRDICQSCERDIDAQGHATDCEWHPDFYEPPVREIEFVGDGD